MACHQLPVILREAIKIHNCWLQPKCCSIQESISYISWLQLAAEYGGCSQLILTSSLI